MTYRTEQEAFWAGEFGDDYIGRNRSAEQLAANLDFFAKALRQAHQPRTCIEFGANIGLNLRALKLLHPGQEQFGIEINAEAARQLAEAIPPQNVMRQSILDYAPRRTFDLVLSKGVLIHINPEVLPAIYDKLHQSVGRYLLVAEYYNPSPVAVGYRGHSDRLFKRDFAGEIMERHPGLVLVDYGFAYRRDPNFPQDDLNWFLMEKRG
jgi:spore coat polysaccharide biosynthesis protein SpsF